MSRAAMTPCRRLQSVCSREGLDFSTAKRLAIDFYTLLPAASRRQIEDMQAMLPDERRMAISEVYDALARGIEIMEGRAA